MLKILYSKCINLKIRVNYYLKSFYRKTNKIIEFDPCYFVVDNLNKNSVMVDVGTGNDADFSQAIIKKYNLKSYGFDPTKKHLGSLKKIEKKYNGNFKIFNYALSAKDGEINFYESQENISGSLSQGHINIKKDDIKEYKVKTTTINNIFNIIDAQSIDLLKIDVEGEEYKIIEALDQDTLSKIGQIVLEFHHHCMDEYNFKDTKTSIKKFEKAGFKTYTDDNINYLFFK